MFTWKDLPHEPQGFERAAAVVAELYRDEPVRAAEVARHIGVRPESGNATRMLARAERAGLVRRIDRSRWIPVV